MGARGNRMYFVTIAVTHISKYLRINGLQKMGMLS